MYLKFTVFWGVRARVRDDISPILRYSKLFAAILGPECLVGFLFKVFLIFSSVPVVIAHVLPKGPPYQVVGCMQAVGLAFLVSLHEGASCF